MVKWIKSRDHSIAPGHRSQDLDEELSAKLKLSEWAFLVSVAARRALFSGFVFCQIPQNASLKAFQQLKLPAETRKHLGHYETSGKTTS